MEYIATAQAVTKSCPFKPCTPTSLLGNEQNLCNAHGCLSWQSVEQVETTETKFIGRNLHTFPKTVTVNTTEDAGEGYCRLIFNQKGQ